MRGRGLLIALIAITGPMFAGCGDSSSSPPSPSGASAKPPSSSALVPKGAACAVDPRPIGKLLGTDLTPDGSEDKGALVYCYYKMSTPSGAGLRLGLLHCADLGNYFNTYPKGTATPTQVGATAGQLKYDPNLNPPSGTAVVIAGSVGARADLQAAGDPRYAPPFSFDPATTLPTVAKMAASTYLETVRGKPTSGTC
jgi:hypothetical protein